MITSNGPREVPACRGNRPAVRPIVSVKCGSCDGFGWVETGFVSDTNVGRGHQCRTCLGTGFVEREVSHA